MTNSLNQSGSPREAGQVLILTFITLGVVLFTVLFIIAGSQVYFQNAQYAYSAEKALALAEAGVDKALASLNKTAGSYSGEEEVVLGEGAYSVVITSEDAVTKLIESTGYVPGKENAKSKRTVKVTAFRGVGISLPYGIQVGEGGLDLNSNNQVSGSVYSNGPVFANSNNEITGDVFVAALSSRSADQETDCVDPNCQDFFFGKIVGAEVRADVAQSFKPATSGNLNKVSIRIKKEGNPADAIVRILQDTGGSPDKNAVLATGTLYSSPVTSEYGFIDVTFNSAPTLNAKTTYWLMVDTIVDITNFWSWQNDLAQSYTRGLPKWSPDWSAGSLSWNSFDGDLSFKVYLGGEPNSLEGKSKFVIGGDAHASIIKKMTINGDAYYQTIADSVVSGDSFPLSPDPVAKNFPISEANITDWKQQAEDAEVFFGDLNINEGNCPILIESKKIVGNVTFNSNCVATLKSPIWITGNLTINSNNTLKLHSDWGKTSGIIVVDGKILVDSKNKLEGTGLAGSILMAITTYDSRTNDIAAIQTISNENTGVFYAANGIIEPGSYNTFAELIAWKIRLSSNSVISYQTGLADTLFRSGPGGSYSLVKGTYQVK